MVDKGLIFKPLPPSTKTIGINLFTISTSILIGPTSIGIRALTFAMVSTILDFLIVVIPSIVKESLG
jgi:hypothetical protein